MIRSALRSVSFLVEDVASVVKWAVGEAIAEIDYRLVQLDHRLQTGRWVCDQLAGGKPRTMIVDWLSHGEGLMPSAYSAPIIVDTAMKHLCP